VRSRPPKPPKRAIGLLKTNSRCYRAIHGSALIRGNFYAGWNPSAVPEKYHAEAYAARLAREAIIAPSGELVQKTAARTRGRRLSAVQGRLAAVIGILITVVHNRIRLHGCPMSSCTGAARCATYLPSPPISTEPGGAAAAAGRSPCGGCAGSRALDRRAKLLRIGVAARSDGVLHCGFQDLPAFTGDGQRAVVLARLRTTIHDPAHASSSERASGTVSNGVSGAPRKRCSPAVRHPHGAGPGRRAARDPRSGAGTGWDGGVKR